MKKIKHNWNLESKDELLEFAWGIIANANGGNWDEADPQWKTAAEIWRGGYFKLNPNIELREDIINKKCGNRVKDCDCEDADLN